MVRDSIFIRKSIGEIHNDFINKIFNPLLLSEYYIEQICKYNGQYLPWVVFDKNTIYEQAKKLKYIEREKFGLLYGIPIGIKDIINTQEFTTEMGSPLWDKFTPGNDARIVYYLKNAGALIAGKTVTAEFAVHTLGKTLNPYNIAKTPGTSSSGSAVAISLGMVPVTIGTQTAGSIVRPASFCGIYGIKPSFGLIPRTGMLKTTDSLDTVGYFVSNAEDIERVFKVITVSGPNYPFSYNALKDKTRQLKSHNKQWRVALVKTHTWKEAENYAQKAILDWAKLISNDSNIEVVEKELPHEMKSSHDVHEMIYNKTLSYYFKDEYEKKELVSPIMNEMIESGKSITIDDYYKALKKQEEMITLMDSFFRDCDIVISLSTAGEAPNRENIENPDPALIWTMTHLPVVSAPVFESPNGLPYGLQIVARKYNDLLLFNFIKYALKKNYIPQGVKPILKI